MCVCVCRYRLAGLPGDYQEKNISSPETNYCLLKDLIIWTQYQIQVAAYTGAGLGVYSSPVTEYTLQGGEASLFFWFGVPKRMYKDSECVHYVHPTQSRCKANYLLFPAGDETEIISHE